MPATFLPFRGSAHLIHGFSKENGEKYDLQKLLIRSAMQLQIMDDRTDFMTALFECVHYTLSHKIVNVTKNIGERFLGSKMNLRLSNLRLPYTLFEVCFEKGLLVPDLNIQMPSCLVIAKADKALLDAVRTLADKVGQEQKAEFGINQRPAEIDDLVSRLLSIKYLDPFATERIGPICHANINTDLDEGKPVSQIIDELPLLARGPMVFSMNDRDKFVQKKILTVVLSTLCYLNTKDPDVQKYKFYDRPKLGKIAPEAIVVGARFDHCIGWHLRQAHFRILEHERFHRDDSGKPRVVWVSAAEVGKGHEPAGHEPKYVEVRP